MSDKKQLIEAFKNLDFKTLDELLDDNRPYMDVTKRLFLDTLKQEISEHKNLKTYENVTNGTCGTCNKGCRAYQFSAKDSPSLNLFFEEDKDGVSDVYLCNDFKLDAQDETEWDIYFEFYDDEKVNFKPSLDYNINVQKVNEAVKEYDTFSTNGYASSKDIVYWHNKHENLANRLNLNDPFVWQPYKAYKNLEDIYREVCHLIHNYNKNNIAKEALKAYKKINKDDERAIVKWVLVYKKQYFYSLKKTDNWQQTGFIILDTKPNLVIDCNECLESFLFDNILNNIKSNLLEKYKPTKGHYEQNKEGFIPTLESFLKLHKKYLDLL